MKKEAEQKKQQAERIDRRAVCWFTLLILFYSIFKEYDIMWIYITHTEFKLYIKLKND